MGRFNNGVSHGSIRGNSFFSNSPIHEHEFPLIAIELWTIVCNHLFWLGTPCQPGVLESARIFGALGRSYPHDFNEISDKVNDQHSPKISNNTLTLQFPGINEIKLSFLGEGSSLSWSKCYMRSTGSKSPHMGCHARNDVALKSPTKPHLPHEQ